MRVFYETWQIQLRQSNCFHSLALLVMSKLLFTWRISRGLLKMSLNQTRKNISSPSLIKIWVLRTQWNTDTETGEASSRIEIQNECLLCMNVSKWGRQLTFFFFFIRSSSHSLISVYSKKSHNYSFEYLASQFTRSVTLFTTLSPSRSVFPLSLSAGVHPL